MLPDRQLPRKGCSGARLPTAANGLLPQWPHRHPVGCLFQSFGAWQDLRRPMSAVSSLAFRSELSSSKVIAK
jgi:hypothetical protein